MHAFFRRYMALATKEVQQLRRNRGLLVQLVVDRSHRQPAAVGTAERVPQESLQRIQVLVETGHAGLHVRLQMLLVPQGTGGHLRIGDGDENTAANVAGDIDES